MAIYCTPVMIEECFLAGVNVIFESVLGYYGCGIRERETLYELVILEAFWDFLFKPFIPPQ